jgi:hypothetical protein
MRLAATVLSAIIFLSSPSISNENKIPVDLELAFVTDASGSIDEEEMSLQRKGYADALTNPRVLNSIKSGFLGSIAVTFIEFSGAGCSKIMIDWTKIFDRASARKFAQKLQSSPRSQCFGGNAIGEAVALAIQSLEGNQFEGTRRVIDVSGDGPNTLDPPIEMVRNMAIKKRVTINALAISRPSMPDLPDYFRTNVIGGPGSFVIQAESREAFAEAILKKIIREIVQNRNVNKTLAKTIP